MFCVWTSGLSGTASGNNFSQSHPMECRIFGNSFDMIYEQAGVTLIIASLAALIAVLCVIPAAVFC